MYLSKEEENRIREELREFARHSRPHLSEEEILKMTDQELSREYQLCCPSNPKVIGYKEPDSTEEENRRFEEFVRRGTEQIRKYRETYHL